jgi:hypothetical protein
MTQQRVHCSERRASHEPVAGSFESSDERHLSAASVYELRDAAQGWKYIAGNLSPNGLGAARRRSHGKIVIRVA